MIPLKKFFHPVIKKACLYVLFSVPRDAQHEAEKKKKTENRDEKLKLTSVMSLKRSSNCCRSSVTVSICRSADNFAELPSSTGKTGARCSYRAISRVRTYMPRVRAVRSSTYIYSWLDFARSVSPLGLVLLLRRKSTSLITYRDTCACACR